MAKRETVEKKRSDAVLNSIATETDTVQVQIQDQDQVFCHRAMIDTGSDWNCLGINQLASLGRTSKSSCISDYEMQNTSVANGRKLTALGYYPVDIQFGPKSANTKLVVFRELDKMT